MSYRKELSLSERKKRLQEAIVDFGSIKNFSSDVLAKYKKQLHDVQEEIGSIKSKRKIALAVAVK